MLARRPGPIGVGGELVVLQRPVGAAVEVARPGYGSRGVELTPRGSMDAGDSERPPIYAQQVTRTLAELVEERLTYFFNHQRDYYGSNCPSPSRYPGRLPLSCISMIKLVLGYAYTQLGDSHMANEINKVYSGVPLAKLLQRNRWLKAWYWSPDLRNRRNMPNRGGANPAKREGQDKGIRNTNSYYGVEVSPNDWAVNYQPYTGNDRKYRKLTPADSTGLDRLKQVALGFGIAHGAEHTFIFMRGDVYEVHWDEPAMSGSALMEKTPLKDWGNYWAEGVIVPAP